MLQRAPYRPSPANLWRVGVGMVLVTAGITAITIGLLLHHAAATPNPTAAMLHTAAGTATTVRTWVIVGTGTTIAGTIILICAIRRHTHDQGQAPPSR